MTFIGIISTTGIEDPRGYSVIGSILVFFLILFLIAKALHNTDEKNKDSNKITTGEIIAVSVCGTLIVISLVVAIIFLA